MKSVSQILLAAIFCIAPISTATPRQNDPQPAQPQSQGRSEGAPQTQPDLQKNLDAVVEAYAKRLNQDRAFANSPEFKALPLDLRSTILARAAQDLLQQQIEEQRKADAAAKAKADAEAKAKIEADAKAKQEAAAKAAAQKQALPPCKKPTLADKIRQNAEAIAQRKENELGRNASKNTGGTIDNSTLPGVQDVTGPDTKKPCAPKGPAQ